MQILKVKAKCPYEIGDRVRFEKGSVLTQKRRQPWLLI